MVLCHDFHDCTGLSRGPWEILDGIVLTDKSTSRWTLQLSWATLGFVIHVTTRYYSRKSMNQSFEVNLSDVSGQKSITNSLQLIIRTIMYLITANIRFTLTRVYK